MQWLVETILSGQIFPLRHHRLFYCTCARQHIWTLGSFYISVSKTINLLVAENIVVLWSLLYVNCCSLESRSRRPCGRASKDLYGFLSKIPICDHVKDSRINNIKTANRLFISATFGDTNLLGKFLDKETFDMKQGLPLHQCNPEVPIKKALASRVSSSSTPSTPSSRSAAALVRGTPWRSTTPDGSSCSTMSLAGRRGMGWRLLWPESQVNWYRSSQSPRANIRLRSPRCGTLNSWPNHAGGKVREAPRA